MEMNNQEKFDDLKSIIRTMEGIGECLILTICYYGIWKSFYKEFNVFSYFQYEKVILMGIYFLLLLVIFILCDSFQYGYQKLVNLVVSQWISIFIIDFITYFQLCLLTNKILNPLGALLLLGVSLMISFICSYIFTMFYHLYNAPKNMVMIYGNEKAIELKFKMDTREDKYHVTSVINIEMGEQYIKEEILKYDAVIINDISANMRNDILKYCYSKGIRTYVVPKISDIIESGGKKISLFDTPLLLVKGRGLSLGQRFLKRITDIILCLIAMIPGAPIMLIIALFIKLEDRGPIFFKQKRVTKNGKIFEILKFRSMIVDAEKGGYDLSMRANGKDPRITKVGRVIRACRVDELPQLLNILKGEMSIVGPRPERIENVEEYIKDVPEFNFRHKVKGGLTGFAQIYGKYNTSAYDKLRLDLIYIENYSIFLDIKLIFMTLQILVRSESTEGFEKREELEKMKKELLQKSKCINEK